VKAVACAFGQASKSLCFMKQPNLLTATRLVTSFMRGYYDAGDALAARERSGENLRPTCLVAARRRSATVCEAEMHQTAPPSKSSAEASWQRERTALRRARRSIVTSIFDVILWSDLSRHRCLQYEAAVKVSGAINKSVLPATPLAVWKAGAPLSSWKANGFCHIGGSRGAYAFTRNHFSDCRNPCRRRRWPDAVEGDR